MHNQFKTQKFRHLMLAMGPRDLNSAPCSPVHCSSHSITIFQSSELTELPVVENSQLFAQRAHSTRYAPMHCRTNREEEKECMMNPPPPRRLARATRNAKQWLELSWAPSSPTTATPVSDRQRVFLQLLEAFPTLPLVNTPPCQSNGRCYFRQILGLWCPIQTQRRGRAVTQNGPCGVSCTHMARLRCEPMG